LYYSCPFLFGASNFILFIVALVRLSLNKINDSAAAAAKEEKEKEAVISLLKTLEDMLRNRIMKKEEEVHRTQNVAENNILCIDINTLHWVIRQSLSIRRLLTGQHSKLSYYYDTASTTKKEF
jgi:hypothetical protein